jgi:diphosphomevalonate decarboxylase
LGGKSEIRNPTSEIRLIHGGAMIDARHPNGSVVQQATAVAHPNIALVKYWGKSDVARNLPAVGSLSITVEGLATTTTVRFDPDLDADRFRLAGREEPAMARRVSACLDELRLRAGSSLHAAVESSNDFPTAAGLASSASGFAALVVAADAALGAGLPRPQLAELARRASGSAPRSLHGGFVELALVDSGRRTETRQLLEPAAWPLAVAVAVTASGPKAVGSTEGMLASERSSPYYAAWVASSPADLAAARAAVAARDFEALAAVSEASCLAMHGVMLATRPGLVYWNGTTVACIHLVRGLRAGGVPVFFTIDAGPQLKAVCLPGVLDRVRDELAAVPGVERVLEGRLGEGARVIAG